MKKIVLFALIAALCAGALLYVYLGRLEQQKQVPIVYENVAVASQNISAYTPITAEMVEIKQVPQGTSHPLAARTAEEVIGFVTESELIEGEEILPAKLKQPGQTESGLSYIVPEGMRAVTVAVDEVSGVAGFLQRGDYVDVIAYTTTAYQPEESLPAGDPAAQAAQTAQTSTATQGTTVVAAQNVCVAAVGTSLTSPAADTGESVDGAAGYSSVTLFLTPEDAMRVVQGAKSGVILLVLRASGDHAENLEVPVVSDMLLQQGE
ncbi:MAG: Flp pilus assembly protein CpaB [Christensenella sp.]